MDWFEHGKEEGTNDRDGSPGRNVVDITNGAGAKLSLSSTSSYVHLQGDHAGLGPGLG